MKRILVVDMPDDSSCIGCPCMAWDDADDWIGCHLTSRQTGVWSEGKADRPKWCPLKPMPEKHENKDKHDYEVGWNDAIEEILGE